MIGTLFGHIGDMIGYWFGGLSRDEVKKFLSLSLVFFFVIGVYWLLRVTKDGVFMSIVGEDWLPTAKILSLVVIMPLILIYTNLVNRYDRSYVFYALTALYGAAALIFSYLIGHPTMGFANTVASPDRILGWAYYVFVESFGSIIVALFWSIIHDITLPESAKKGYYLVNMGGQIGAILGSLVVAGLSESLGTSTVLFIGGCSIFAVTAAMWAFMTFMPKHLLVSYANKPAEGEAPKKEKKPGALDGLKLIITQPYLMAIFAVIALYEVIVTIFDFRFKILVKQYSTSADNISAWLGWFGVATNFVALICILANIGAIARRLGVRVALAFLPVLIAALSIVMAVYPSGLYVALGVMVLAKAINYALNQPTKEQLYIPTSKSAKYGAKAFVDIFGSRSSKAGGSLINMAKTFLSPVAFLYVSTFASLGLCAVWFFTALYLGARQEKAVANNEVIC